jgi:hypothetical protein
MMRRPFVGKRIFGACAAATLAAATTAAAHHSPAAYDQTTQIVIEGTITKIAWVNPHVYFTLAVPGPGGSTVEQEVQAGSPAGLKTLGVGKNALAVGDRVAVRAYPNRRGSGRVVWGLSVKTAAGKGFPVDFFAGTDPAAPTVVASGLAGSWVPQLAGLAFGNRVPGKLTAAGAAARDDVEGYRNSVATCGAWPAPQIMLIPIIRSIEVGDTAVRLRFDWMSAERVVHLDQAAHPAGVPPTLAGHSIGRWEGATLVVDTVAFEPNRSGIAVGVPSGPRKHLVERLSLAEDRLHLRYDFTIEDPEYLSAPVTFSELWDHRPDLEPSGDECDAATARRFLVLE